MKREDKFEWVDVYMMQSEILIIDPENMILRHRLQEINLINCRTNLYLIKIENIIIMLLNNSLS
jgi:hypothetical protein